MTHELPPVETLGDADADEVVDVLCEAFRDYPVMRYVLGQDRSADPGGLRALVRYFVMARVLRGETMLGIGPPSDLEGAALISRPDSVRSPPGLAALRERLWERLGDAARARYEAFGAATAPFAVDVPHIHLNMIGVRDRVRGRGVGRALIERVHALSAGDETSEGVTLTTELPSNVPLYEHFGYSVVGRARVAPELETWGFYRADPT